MTEREFKRFEREILTGTVRRIQEDELKAIVKAGRREEFESIVISERSAADLLGVKVGNLKKRRKKGWAPLHVKIRRQVFYLLADVLERKYGGGGALLTNKRSGAPAEAGAPGWAERISTIYLNVKRISSTLLKHHTGQVVGYCYHL
jgi:hypothetical protein